MLAIQRFIFVLKQRIQEIPEITKAVQFNIFKITSFYDIFKLQKRAVQDLSYQLFLPIVLQSLKI